MTQSSTVTGVIKSGRGGFLDRHGRLPRPRDDDGKANTRESCAQSRPRADAGRRRAPRSARLDAARDAGFGVPTRAVRTERPRSLRHRMR